MAHSPSTNMTVGKLIKELKKHKFNTPVEVAIVYDGDETIYNNLIVDTDTDNGKVAIVVD